MPCLPAATQPRHLPQPSLAFLHLVQPHPPLLIECVVKATHKAVAIDPNYNIGPHGRRYNIRLKLARGQRAARFKRFTSVVWMWQRHQHMQAHPACVYMCTYMRIQFTSRSPEPQLSSLEFGAAVTELTRLSGVHCQNKACQARVTCAMCNVAHST